MSKQFSFEKLLVWQEAKNLTLTCYQHTRKLPKIEIYGLTSQILRSSNSVNSNIAEGTARRKKKDQAKYYTVAYSSLIETLNHIIIAFELGYVAETEYNHLREKVTGISYKLNALRKSTDK